jgi:hypothetical protein
VQTESDRTRKQAIDELSRKLEKINCGKMLSLRKLQVRNSVCKMLIGLHLIVGGLKDTDVSRNLVYLAVLSSSILLHKKNGLIFVKLI